MAVDSLPPAPEIGDTGACVAGVCNSNLLLDDPSKKIRKPYTITKSRKNWTDIEHEKFLEALHLFDRDWKKIEAFVGSKTAIQIRSHAQKYFLKVQKSGTNEHVPPPRPKRKAAHPYPHKAPKNAVSNVGVLQSSTDLLEADDVIIKDSYLWPTNPGSNTVLSSCMYNTVPPVTGSVLSQDGMRSSDAAISHNCCSSSIDSCPRLWPTGETNNPQNVKQSTETTNQQNVKQITERRVLPDFAKVYRFIGSIFDPDASSHLQRLKMMDPVDVEAVVLLMKNLCANLKSPQFDQYRKLFSSYDAYPEGTNFNNSFANIQALAMPPSVISSS